MFWPVKLLKSQKLRSKTFFFLAWIKVLREADSLASSSKCRHIRQDWNWIFHSGRLPNCLGEVFESACDHFDSFSTTSKGRSKKIWAQILKGKYFLQTLRNLWFHTRLEFLSRSWKHFPVVCLFVDKFEKERDNFSLSFQSLL